MRGKLKIVVLLLLCANIWACQDLPTEKRQSFSLPTELQVRIDSNTIDTSLGYPLALPLQWMDKWSPDTMQLWIDAQHKFSTRHLQTSNNFSTHYGDQQIIGFPKKVNNTYYALANFKGIRGIYKGTDLSTLSTYQPFLLDSTLNLPAYHIKDFAILDSNGQQIALLLYQDQTQQYKTAHYNFQEDSVTLWVNLNVRPEWQVKDDDIWVHSPQDSLIFQIQINQPELTTYALDMFQEYPVQFLAPLDSNQVLVQVQEAAEQSSYYQISSQNPPQKIFTFKNGHNQWLGFHKGTHYFQADFKTGHPQVFSYRSTPKQDLLKTLLPATDTLLIRTQIVDSTIICLYHKLAYSELRTYQLDGQLLSKIPLAPALSSIDFKHYPNGNHTLVRQLSPEDGLRWLNVDTMLPTVAEPVYRSLIAEVQLSFKTSWRSIKSYDGVPFPIVIYTKPSDIALDKRPSIIIPVSSNLEVFREQLVDLAVVNRSLLNEAIVVFLFPRGNRNRGKSSFSKGSGPYLQLAYDDLQACISYLNEKRIGLKDQRTVWGIQEGALSAAALFMQRPELAANIILEEGIYDLRSSLSNFHYEAWPWINTKDTLSNRLSIKYSPQFYPIRSALYPNCLVQTSNQSIFAPQSQSLKWIGRLQNIPGAQATYLYTKNTDTETKEWEQIVWNFINR